MSPEVVLMAAMPLPDVAVPVIWNETSPAANSVVPLTTSEPTAPVSAGDQPATTAPPASSNALSSNASVAMNTRPAACPSAVTTPPGAGLGAHAVTEPPADTCAA